MKAAILLILLCLSVSALTAQEGPSKRKAEKLYEAVRTGETGKAEDLLKQGASPDFIVYGNSAFHLAVILGDIPLVELFLEHGADMYGLNADGRGVIYFVEKPGIMEMFLKAGADPDRVCVPQTGETPLMAAAGRRIPELVSLLLDYGADPDAEDLDGRTAVHYSLLSFYNQSMELLPVLRILSDGDAGFDRTDSGGNTPLSLATSNGSQEAFSFLFEWEQTRSPGFTGGRESRELYLQDIVSRIISGNGNAMLDQLVLLHDSGVPVNLNIPDSKGRTPAYYVTDSKSVREYTAKDLQDLQTLDRLGARFDTADNNGVTPLLLAAKTARADLFTFILDWEQRHSPGFSGGFPDRETYCTRVLGTLLDNHSLDLGPVEAILQAGARASGYDADGDPLVFTHGIGADSPALLTLLIQNGASPSAVNQRGETLLIYTVDFLWTDDTLIRTLVSLGADPNQRTVEGKTALMYPFKLELFHSLISLGADPFAADNQGKTVLHYAARSSEEEALPFLVSLGIPVDIIDKEGLTPLMEAAGHPRINAENILTLLDLGADPSLLSPDGRTVLHQYFLAFNDTDWFNREVSFSVAARLLDEGTDPGTKDLNGDSALQTVFRNRKYCDPELFTLVTGAAQKEDLAEAEQMIRQVDRIRWQENLLDQRNLVLAAILIPLALTGFNIIMRELVYRKKRDKNWMGPLNAFIILGMGLAAVSALLAGYAAVQMFLSGQGSTGHPLGVGLAAGFFGIIAAAAGGFLGLIGGTILARRPSVKLVFTRNPLAYYASSGISIIIGIAALVHMLTP